LRNPKNNLFLSLLISSLLIMACGKQAVGWIEGIYPNYSSYMEIPEVTEEEIAAIQKIQASGKVFIFGANPSTEAFFNEDSTYGGYCSLLTKRLSELFGITFIPGIYEWSDLMEGLKNHTIDFSGELTATPERRETFFMTRTSSERSIKTMRISGGEPLNQLGKRRTLNYGFLDGTTTLDSVDSYIINSYNPVFVDDYEEAYALLKSGEMDAFFDESPAEAAFDSYGDVTAEDFFPLVYSQVSISTGNPSLAPIISVIDKYLGNGGTRELAHFSNQGYQEYQRHKFLSQLSAEENIYLLDLAAREGVIPICAEFDNYPVSFWNEQEKEYQGIALDVLKEIEKLSSLHFEPQNKENKDWSELKKMLESGEAAVITELIRSDERTDNFLWSGMPYTIDYYALISKAEYHDISINEILYSKVGIITDTAHAYVFREWFPKHPDVIEFGAYDVAVKALEAGTIDLLMANHNLLLWITNYLEMPGYKANIVFNHPYESFFGFNINEGMLCSIMDKAMKLIDSGSIANGWTRRLFDYRSKLARAQVPWLAGSLALFVSVVILLVVMLVRKRSEGRRLEKIIHQRTKDLEAQTTAAQIASRAKGEFLAHMSHEIRTPLNAIIGMTLVAQKGTVSEKTKSSLEEISAASNHLLGILNDILDMSKIESGKFALIHEPFDILEALEEVSEITKTRCLEKQLRFVPEYNDIPDITVLGDKLRLKQVLINLLGNSVKFTPEGGKVNLKCSISRSESREPFFGFSVIDSGIGMTEEQINKLFTPFEQTDNTIAVRFGGTGLGLVISQDLVNQMGGQISVKSSPGKGSVFSFTIGLEVTESKTRETRTTVDSIPDLSGKRILLAEDIDINRLIIAELLSETNVSMEEATDGSKALEKFSSSVPGYYDFIFMDIQMPNMDGYEASRRIREVEKERNSSGNLQKPVPIYAMTANAYREDIDRAMQAGMNGHVSKPIDIKIIMKILVEYFSC